MNPLFFRDGTPYKGNEAFGHRPICGEARVQMRPICSRCSGSGRVQVKRPAGYSLEVRCARCYGYGRMPRAAIYRLYTTDRLHELDARRNRRGLPSLSALAVKETRAEFVQFIRERDKLITEVFTYAPLSETLQAYRDRIDCGLTLTASEIRHVKDLLKNIIRRK